MTPDQEVQELRRWSAETVMGWQEWDHHNTDTWYDNYWYKESKRVIEEESWRPDQDLTQCFGVFVEKMKELGWHLTTDNHTFPTATFYQDPIDGPTFEGCDPDMLGIAILRAGKSAWNERRKHDR